jgi:hypothetical protein
MILKLTYCKNLQSTIQQKTYLPQNKKVMNPNNYTSEPNDSFVFLLHNAYGS